MSKLKTDGYTFRIVSNNFDIKINDIDLLLLIGSQILYEDFKVVTDKGIEYDDKILNYLINSFDDELNTNDIIEIFRNGK